MADVYFSSTHCEERKAVGYDYFTDEPNQDYIPIHMGYDPNFKYQLFYHVPLPRNKDYFINEIKELKEKIYQYQGFIFQQECKICQVNNSRKRNKKNLIQSYNEYIERYNKYIQDYELEINEIQQLIYDITDLD
jgi:hypothetical protein